MNATPHRTRLTAAVVLASLAAAALSGCQPTLGPGEDWYTYSNDQNSIAKIAIDGTITGPFYAAGESRRIPLATSRDHSVTVSHGSFTTVLVGGAVGSCADFTTDYVPSVIDPPFTITWSPEHGWTRRD